MVVLPHQVSHHSHSCGSEKIGTCGQTPSLEGSWPWAECSEWFGHGERHIKRLTQQPITQGSRVLQ